MASTKSQGSSSNGRDSRGQRLGVKCFGGQQVLSGHVLVRQRGTQFLPGRNVRRGCDDTLYAVAPGVVRFEWVHRGKQRISIVADGGAPKA